jgi:radical SAM protein with 4Fe4S-binding SPASM domain
MPPTIVRRLENIEAIVPISPPPTAFHLGIGLTRDCTLACRYCHADAGKRESVDWRTLERAIDYAFGRARNTPKRVLSASFAVGGEPTMEWELFKRTVSELRRRAGEVDQVFLSMTTNGYYGDMKRNFIAAHFDIVTVSLDGPPSIQDVQRPTRAGRPSYKTVADTIKSLVAAGSVRVAVRATVSAASVDALPQIVNYFAADFGRSITISFEPLVKLGRAVRNEDATVPDMTRYTRAFLEARNVGRALGVHVTSSGASIQRLVARFCGAMAIPSFAVCTDGSVTACHRDQNATDYGYGAINDDGEVVIDATRLQNLSLLNNLPAECSECFAKWHCAGDCPDLRRIGWSRCDFNRALVYDDITRALARPKGGDKNAE